MKQSTITVDGKRYALPEARARGLAPLKMDAANSDQIAVGRVLVEIEGEEPVDLMLPVSMIELLLEGIGAGPAAAAPAEPIEEPAEEVAMESKDADEDEKLDAKIMRLATKIAADAIKAHDAKRTAADALRTSVNADAARVLPPGYDYKVHWTQVAVDAIAKAHPDSETRAKEFAAKSCKGDAVAQGRLLELLSQSVTSAATTSPTPKPKADSQAKPWESPTIPEVTQ